MPETKALIGHGITFEMADPATPTTWIYVAEVFNIEPGEEATDQADATHMQSPNRDREYIPTMNDNGSISMDMNYVPGSATDLALIAAKGKKRRCRLTYPNGVQLLFSGSRESYSNSATFDGKMEANVSFKISGSKTLTAATAPRNITAPSHAGAAVVGTPLVVDPGVWAGYTSISYQWTAGGTDIVGATGSTYVPVSGDVGDPIACEVTAANADFSTTVTTTATTNVTSS